MRARVLGLSAFAVASIALAFACERPAEEIASSTSAQRSFEASPMALTGAFDGSYGIRMWLDTMSFARKIEGTYQKPLHFTYFINTCYYDHTVQNSAIGTSEHHAQDMLRWAITQQAVNEGHEIGDHTVRHWGGGAWSHEQWRAELVELRTLAKGHLFKPILDETGAPVFPRWRALADAPARSTGASCNADGDCDSNRCIHMTPSLGVCTNSCRRDSECPQGALCGRDDGNGDADVCIPTPAYPIIHRGQELFDAEGNPNLAHPALEPYDIVGFRAPLLEFNTALFDVLEELGYRYDTSVPIVPGPPARVAHGGRTYESMYELGLMRYPDTAHLPMDYGYFLNDVSGDRMLDDYKRSIVSSYSSGRLPWNIGHHFSLWKDGAYWEAMKSAFEFAAQGCPDGAGNAQCAEVRFPSFRELSDVLDGKSTLARQDLYRAAPKADHAVLGRNHSVECSCGH
jgi:peptidoglycan/xylan/chitin deacetylase (PgdA/CDA1 family)